MNKYSEQALNQDPNEKQCGMIWYRAALKLVVMMRSSTMWETLSCTATSYI